jgi:tetratricopeptide (TPR) repeat protein
MNRLSSKTSVGLDNDELVHLALYAMRNDRHDEAMSLLKRAIEASPDSATAHYLLGAEHAQIGLYDRAVAEMAESVRLDPGIPAAHFQLGLLHLTAGRVREAEAAWQPLERLAVDEPLRLFKSALLHLVSEERELCIQELQAGIARNTLNEALNDDMRRLLADLQARRGGGTDTRQDTREGSDSNRSQAPPQVPVPSKRMLLSTYEQNPDDTATD